MPSRWLQELEQTSLLIHLDPPFTWAQAWRLLVSTPLTYQLARAPFGALIWSLPDWRIIVPFLELFIAIIFMVVGWRLGNINIIGPNLIRLLSVHINMCMLMLASNLLYKWAEVLRLHWLSIAAWPSVLVTIIFFIYTWPKRKEREGNLIVMCLWAIIATVLNTCVIYWFILPT